MRVRAPVSAKVIRQSAMSVRQVLDLAPRAEHEVVGHRLVVAQEVVLDHVRPVAQAEHEVLVAVVGVVAHHVPQDRPVPDPGHRLGQDVGGAGEPQPLTAAEQDDLHSASLPDTGGPTSASVGSGTTNRVRPASSGSCGHDLGREVPGEDEELVRAACRRGRPGRGSGCRVPGRYRPCLAGDRSTVNGSASTVTPAALSRVTARVGAP